ncbi:hypothetical protein C7M84_023397 [Penaeus vannamei]|uniref:Uncharacterized protein n=1 Tax=Penaeus vannamei TaxID=6689 RepID=A0A3R7QM36_PENVA|nr:hypothetical protein C7M84_023397 [Penaeus vannamei]
MDSSATAGDGVEVQVVSLPHTSIANDFVFSSLFSLRIPPYSSPSIATRGQLTPTENLGVWKKLLGLTVLYVQQGYGVGTNSVGTCSVHYTPFPLPPLTPSPPLPLPPLLPLPALLLILLLKVAWIISSTVCLARWWAAGGCLDSKPRVYSVNPPANAQELDPSSRSSHGPRSAENKDGGSAAGELSRLLEQREGIITELRKQMHQRDKTIQAQRAQFEEALRNSQNGKRDSSAARMAMSGGAREELQLVRDAISSLRSNFRETDPNQHTLDTLEQAIAVLIERAGGGVNGGVNGVADKSSRPSHDKRPVNVHLNLLPSPQPSFPSTHPHPPTFPPPNPTFPSPQPTHLPPNPPYPTKPSSPLQPTQPNLPPQPPHPNLPLQPPPNHPHNNFLPPTPPNNLPPPTTSLPPQPTPTPTTQPPLPQPTPPNQPSLPPNPPPPNQPSLPQPSQPPPTQPSSPPPPKASEVTPPPFLLSRPHRLLH